MRDKGRLIFWMAFLAGAGILAALPEWLPPRGEIVETAHRGDSADLRTVALQAKPQQESPGQAEVKGGGMEGVGATNLFAAKTWLAPQPLLPPPQLPPPSAPPSAPPLPFQFMGKFDDGAILKAFLQQGENAYVVTVGDVIDDTYRVAAITPEQLTLIYLPLNTAQILPVGNPP